MVRICSDGSELHTVIRVAARERRPNGAMAQLVARFHGMEEVGGSNPPSSTENSDTQVVSVGFLLPKRRVCEPCFRVISCVGAVLWGLEFVRGLLVVSVLITRWSGYFS